jgi:eukaryotic-like serine/threonine-protein kinase
MSKYCPSCKSQYPDNLAFCTEDGTRLVVVEVEDTGGEEDRFIGKILEGKYLLESLVGRGGMGNVYRARHLQMETHVAVKILHASLVSDSVAVERFRREAKTALNVNHPNIIQIMDFGVTEEHIVFIVMELLQGISLQKIIEQEGKIALDRAVWIFKHVCAAVGTAHAKNVIHRDIKPDNIFILNYGQANEIIKVLDFSIAKVADKGQRQLTEAGLVVGTPQYMSPEQAQGLELDTRADIYSLGVTLYHMLSGTLPFTAASSMALALKHIHALPRPIREVNAQLSSAVESVVMKSLAKRAIDRYQTAFEFSEEFEQAASKSTTSGFNAIAASAKGQKAPTSPHRRAANTDPLSLPTNTDHGRLKAIRNEAVNSMESGVSVTTPIPESAAVSSDNNFAPSSPIIGSVISVPEPVRNSSNKKLIAIFGVLIIGLIGFGSFLWQKNQPIKPSLNPYLQNNMKLVTGNSFKMGRPSANEVSPDETPEHSVSVGDFWLGAYEVTNAEYKKFIDAERYPAPSNWVGNNIPPGIEDSPVINISWNDAVAYCRWLSQKSQRTFRLPTEEEWEYAARGIDGRLYPWGQTWQNDYTVSGESLAKGGALPIKSPFLEKDVSPFGIYGLAGNVSEWTTSPYSLYPGSSASKDDNCNQCKMLRGGNYKSKTVNTTATFRAWKPAEEKNPLIGFRVAADVLPEDYKAITK